MPSQQNGSPLKNPKKPKSREVSSRFLSFHENHGYESPKSTLNQRPRFSVDSRKHESFENSGFLRSLWPSSSPHSSKAGDNLTLGDHLGKDRLRDKHKHNENKSEDPCKPPSFDRQRSCREIEKKSLAKENHKPFFGGSMRYTGKFKFPGKSSPKPFEDFDSKYEGPIVPGRFSVDESALRKKSSYIAKGLSDSDTQDSESEYSDVCSGNTSFDTPLTGKHLLASYMAPTESSSKHGIDIPSRFLQDFQSRSKRWSSDSSSGVLDHKPFSMENRNTNNGSNYSSPKLFPSKNGVKNVNGSNLMRADSSKLFDVKKKPPASPSKGKGVGNFLSMGIELLKGKKSTSSSSSSLESFHPLKLLHNRLMQWRFCNAKSELVSRSLEKHAESNFLQAWDGLTKLQHSVIEKRLLLQREKLEIKLNYIIQSQIKALEHWGNVEEEHLSAVSTTKDYLHHVVCRIPLVDGAKVDTQSASTVLRHASDLTSTMDSMVAAFSPAAENTVGTLFELARVVAQEKLLLEECLEIFRHISALEVQERSLKSSILQFHNS